MQTKIKLLEFIKSNKDWEEILSEKPYGLKIKRDSGFIMFSYSQIESDFNLELVREARGIIFNESTWECVCYPFSKFGNYGESYVPEIDWESARIFEKLDGSLIKLWFYKQANTWVVSTNGTISADKAELMEDVARPKHINNYGELFLDGAERSGLKWNILNKDYCYMFEVVSPWNRIVVPYDKTQVFHIGTRNMITLEEVYEDIGVLKPLEYQFGSLDECILNSEHLPFSQEGYVVQDKNFNRVKVKSVQYVAAHHLRGNGQVTMKRIIEMCLITKEQEEFLTYFPEYESYFADVLGRLAEAERSTEGARINIEKNPEAFPTRKKLAEYIIKKTTMPSFMFAWYDGKVKTLEEWFSLQTSEKVARQLGYD